MTLNAILRYPDVYKMGMAVAPVPDLRLYDTIYQERYMGLPADNVDAYRQGSPITFAGQLKGDLLVVHGSGFGQAPGTRHIRIVFLPDEATLGRAYSSIADFLRERCG